MSAALIVADYLTDPAIAALVGDRWAFAELPANTAYPAIRYSVISDVPVSTVAALAERQRNQTRVQVDIYAANISTIESIAAALRQTLHFQHATTVAGYYVVDARQVYSGGVTRDRDAGVWSLSVDFAFDWYDN